jgi:hypothetical protein
VQPDDAADWVEKVPAWQSSHAPLPAAALYVPGVHAAHAPPFGPENPARQTQTTDDVLASADNEF